MKQKFTLLPLLMFFWVLVTGVSASAAPAVFTYEGYLTDSGGAFIVTPVTVHFEVYGNSGSNCLLYSETHTGVNASTGNFSLNVGSGSSQVYSGSSTSLGAVFDNTAAMTGASSCSFNPVSGSAYRFLRVVVNSVTLGDVILTSTPRSLVADKAESLGGSRENNFLRVDNSAAPTNTTSLTPAQLSEFWNLILGTSTVYERSGRINGLTIPSLTSGQALRMNSGVWQAYTPLTSETDPSVSAFAKAALPTCTTGQALYSNGTAFSCVTPTGSTPTLVEADIPTLTTAGKVSGSAINSGTIGGSTAINTTGTIATSGAITAGSMSSSTGSHNTLQIWRPDNLASISITASPSSSYSLILPPNPGASGNVLSTNGSGALSWISAGGTGTVTSVGVSVPSYMSVTGSPVTGSGTMSLGFGSQLQNRVFAAPVSADGAPDFRYLQISDIKSSTSGNFLLASGSCPAGQHLDYQSPADNLSCAAYAITSSQVTNALGYTPVNRAGDTMTGNLNLPNSGLSVGTTQFAVTAGGIGIGTVSPLANLEIATDGSNSSMRVTSHNNTAAWASGVNFYRSRGTMSTPTAVNLNDILGAIYASGYGTTGPAASAKIDFKAEEGFTNSARGTSIGFYTAPVGSTSVTQVMTVHASGSVGIGTNLPNATSALDIQSSTKGFLAPRMTTTQRDAITTPATGLQIYNSTTNELNYYNGTSWNALGTAGSGITALTGDITASGTGSVAATIATGAVNSAKILDGSIAAGDLSTDITSRLFTYASSNLYYTVGNVGVGTNNPATRLHVVGTSGTTLRIVDGNQAAGRVLTSDANGVASWAADAGAPLGSPAFTGTPTAPTAAVNTNTTQLATTAFVLAQASGSTPAMNGTAAAGAGTTFARSDHVHPVDTSRAPAAGSASITTLGTIATGTWNGSTIGVGYGGTGSATGSITGTGALTFAAGGTNQPVTLTPSGTSNVTISNGGMYVAGGNILLAAGGRLGIGTTVPAAALDLASTTDAISLPRGNTGARPGTPVAGMLRYNNFSTYNYLEYYNGTAWDVVDSQQRPLSKDVAYAAVTDKEIHFVDSRYEPISSAGTANIVGFGTSFTTGGSGNLSSANLSGARIRTNHNQSGALGTLTGISNVVSSNSAGTISSAYGMDTTLATVSTGQITNAIGNRSTVEAYNANIGSAVGVKGDVRSGTSRTITNAVGMGIQVETNGGAITNAYGLKIDSVQGTNRWAVYQTDSGANNYFNGRIGVGKNNPAYPIEVVGDVYASGNMIATAFNYISDARYKQDIEPVDQALEKILQIRGVSYNWRRDEFPEKNLNDRHQIGVLAQEVEAQFPELVTTNPDGYKSVNYSALVSPLIEAVRSLYHRLVGVEGVQAEQQREIASVKAENAALKARDEAKDQKIKVLEARLQKIEELLQSK